MNDGQKEKEPKCMSFTLDFSQECNHDFNNEQSMWNLQKPFLKIGKKNYMFWSWNMGHYSEIPARNPGKNSFPLEVVLFWISW